MDFNKDRMASTGSGVYEYLDESLLPPLYIAFRNDLSEGSEIVHSMLREQFIRKEPKVLEEVSSWVRLTDELREALSRGHQDRLTGLMNENFDIRRRICRISEENQAMVDAARSAGASAKFTGSGGAIIGTCSPDSGLDVLRSTLEPLGITVIQPTIAPRVQN